MTIETELFFSGLKKLMDGAYEFIEGAREINLEQKSKEGVVVYIEEIGKLGFQVTSQYKRPADFLQSLLDMVRVNYEPSILGTFFLNSNMELLYDEVRSKQLEFGYGSLISRENQDFESFFEYDLMPYLQSCGYDNSRISTLIFVVTTGEERYNFKLVKETSRVLNSGFSADEALGLVASSIESTTSKPSKAAYAGYCLDPALGNRLRCSVWFLIGGNG